MNKLRNLFGIDTRALAIFRIGIGLIILIDVINYLPDVSLYFSDEGLLPRMAVIQQPPSPWALSIHLLNGTPQVQYVLLGLQALCALGLMFGYQTRWMTFFSYLLLISLHRRNPMIMGGGDDYFRLLLFWSLFLPLGAKFSVDSSRALNKNEIPIQIFSVGTAAMLIQNAVGYFMAALHKWPLPMWQDGTAVYYALNIDNYAKNFALTLLQFPDLLSFITHATLWFELIAPILLFLPWATAYIRTPLVAGFLLMHLGFYLCLHLMLFPWVSSTALLLFLPKEFWDKIGGLKLWDRVTTAITGSHIYERLPRKFMTIHASPAANLTAALTLVCVLLYNYERITQKTYRMPAPLKNICDLLHINQAWRMFAPPAMTNGWFLVPGKLADGNTVDLFRDGKKLDWTKPSASQMFPSERWRRYLFNHTYGKNKNYWPYYGEYLCRTWNATHSGPQRLQSLELIFMAKKTPPPGQVAEYTKRVMLKHSCVKNTKTHKQKTSQPNSSASSKAIVPSGGIRAAAVADKFYPGDPATLSSTVDQLLNASTSKTLPGSIVALLVPHAAYQYSGGVAANGYHQLNNDTLTFILIGPAHRVPVKGGALWAKGFFETPLGKVPVNEDVVQELLTSNPLFVDSALPHQQEHSLEAQLPFLQRRFSNFKIVPLLISTDDVKTCRLMAESIAQVAKKHNALIIISTDLAHYPDQASALRIDPITLSAIQQMDAGLVNQTVTFLKKQFANKLKTPLCGQGAVQTGIIAAKLLGATNVTPLAYANSGDAPSGDINRVVGYAALAFLKEDAPSPEPVSYLHDPELQQMLLKQAAQSITEQFDNQPLDPAALSHSAYLNLPASAFVTIELEGRLRGCRGSTTPTRSLWQEITVMARESAFQDPRFPPLTKEEFQKSKIKISVLTPPRVISDVAIIQPRRHGVIVSKGKNRGIFLPSVWSKIPDKETFLSRLCSEKAKLPNDCWKDAQTRIQIFSTIDFHQ